MDKSFTMCLDLSHITVPHLDAPELLYCLLRHVRFEVYGPGLAILFIGDGNGE